MWLAYGIVFLTALVVALLMVPLCRAVALRYGILDNPGYRKIHAAPKPYLGGLAVYISFTSTVLAGFAAVWLLQDTIFFQQYFGSFAGKLPGMLQTIPQLLAIFAGMTIMLLTGLWDDVSSSSYGFPVKVALQFGAACLAVGVGVRIDFFTTPWINIPISLLWIVGITNAFNLLDNMDGLASGVAFVALAIFSTVAMVLGQWYVAMILLAFAGSLLGFLKYNSYPSTIFLGDAGSLVVGYLMGTFTILESYVDGQSITYLSVFMPLLILGVPLADTFSVIVIRTLNGKPIYVGDKNHLSHRLVAMGLTQRGAVWLLYLTSLALGANALLLPWLGWWEGLLLLAQSSCLAAIFLVMLHFGTRRAKNLDKAAAGTSRLATEIETVEMEAGLAADSVAGDFSVRGKSDTVVAQKS